MGLLDGKQIKDSSIPNSKLIGPIGISLTPTVVKTGAYNAAAGDFIPCDTTSSGFTVTLPSAPPDKTQVAVEVVTQGGFNIVTIACGGTDVLNIAGGVTSATITLPGQSIWLQYKLSTGIWYVLTNGLPNYQKNNFALINTFRSMYNY